MQNKREKLELLRTQLENESSTFTSHWRDLSDYILPRRSRFTITDANKGERKNQKIIDSTATLAARTLRSGMMSGITSPARPWFRLSTNDPDMAEFGPVKEWLYAVSNVMTGMFLRSNLYNCLPIIYGDMGVFGTACLSIEEDFDDVVRFYPFAIGSYRIANNSKLKVDVFQRDFRMTVRQIVQKFGQMKNGKPDWSIFSSQVKSAWDNGLYETWIDVSHVVQPNEGYQKDKAGQQYKKYSSCYYERGYMGQANGMYSDGRILRESGYNHFPILAPRWEITGEDVYGTSCPGMDALGDIKQLQIGERRGAQALEKMVNPPMTGPTSLMNRKASIASGDITYVDSRDAGSMFRPAHETNLRLDNEDD